MSILVNSPISTVQGFKLILQWSSTAQHTPKLCILKVIYKTIENICHPIYIVVSVTDISELQQARNGKERNRAVSVQT